MYIEPGTKNKEQRTKNKEQRTKNTDHKLQNTEHRTQNTEHRTRNTEHRTMFHKFKYLINISIIVSQLMLLLEYLWFLINVIEDSKMLIEFFL